jgi:hypothetical protein
LAPGKKNDAAPTPTSLQWRYIMQNTNMCTF